MPKRPSQQGQVKMVEVGSKRATAREAVATACVSMKESTFKAIGEGSLPKGDVLTAAKLAAIMAAKRTPEIVPLCHPIPISGVEIDFELLTDPARVQITTAVRATAQTGVEMEALVAAAVAALTIYDMCKAVDPEMEVGGLRLLKKSGGKSGRWKRRER